VNRIKSKPRQPFWGLLRRRECLRATRRGWALLLVAAAGLLILLGLTVHPFLAADESVPSKVMVVEGWLPDYALQEAAAEFQRNGYTQLYVTGVPLTEGSYLLEYKTYAQLGAATLVKLGLGSNVVQAVPAPEVPQDRTYTSAATLRKWLGEQGPLPEALTVVSLGPHARRTRLLFQKALGPKVKVGIRAIGVREYDPQRWWASSNGVRNVVDEAVAYAYARFLFRAKNAPPPG
jgi:hypothetical protein